jgi:DNA-binding GntR family transcriptional regulator
MRPLQRPKLLVEMATEAVREMIVSGALDLGARLSEQRIADALGISITPVRDAFARLAHEGLLEVVPQKGTFVFRLSRGDLNQLCEARVAIEPAALRLAHERASAALVAALRAVVARMEAALGAGDVKAYLELDTEFHETLVAASGNAYLVQAYGLIAAKVATLRLRLGTDPHHVGKSRAEHAAIVEALREDRLDEALGVLRRHIARKEGSYWEHLDRDTSCLLRA